MSNTKERNARIARQTRTMFLLALFVVLLISALAISDILFDLGWGYNWNDVLMGAFVAAAAVVIYWVCTAIFRFVDRLGY